MFNSILDSHIVMVGTVTADKVKCREVFNSCHHFDEWDAAIFSDKKNKKQKNTGSRQYF